MVPEFVLDIIRVHGYMYEQWEQIVLKAAYTIQ